MDEMGRTSLHYAALEDRSTEIEELIAGGLDVDCQDNEGFTPLHFAAQEYAVESARKLLQCGAQVDVKNGWGNTPLFTATFNSRGRGELIELLLGEGADPDLSNNWDQTPRGLAKLIGNYDVKQFFEDV